MDLERCPSGGGFRLVRRRGGGKRGHIPPIERKDDFQAEKKLIGKRVGVENRKLHSQRGGSTKIRPREDWGRASI